MASTSEEWMTAGEAAAFLGISKARMADFIARGVLPYSPGQFDRRVKFVKRADVERLASEQRPKARVAVA